MHQDANQISPSEGRSEALLPADSTALLVTLQAVVRKCEVRLLGWAGERHARCRDGRSNQRAELIKPSGAQAISTGGHLTVES